MSEEKKTSEKLRQTNENLIISEVRSLNIRVAELLEQFSLLTMEIGNVADELERQQVGVDVVKVRLSDLKEQFHELRTKLGQTVARVDEVEKRVDELDERTTS